MKRIPVFTALFSSVLLMTSHAADAPVTNPQEEVLTMIREVQNQQLEIAANQVKIETRLATIAEALRIARINASRGGR